VFRQKGSAVEKKILLDRGKEKAPIRESGKETSSEKNEARGEPTTGSITKKEERLKGLEKGASHQCPAR